MLQTGDVVPADVRLLAVSELTVDEADAERRAVPRREADGNRR